MFAALLALALAARAEEPCLPDGGIGRFDPLPDTVAARFGPTIAGLAAAWHGSTWKSDWQSRVAVWPRDDEPELPREIRVPVPAPAPLDARVIVTLGDRACLPLSVRRHGAGEASVALDVALPARLELTWGGRVVEATDLGATRDVGVGWDAEETLIFVHGACPPAPLTGTPTDVPFAHCFDGAWKTALARGKWPTSERAAIVALLARTRFGDLPFDAGLALAARTDLTATERAALGVPARGRADGDATFVHGDGARPRVAVNGVPATKWRDDGTLALPAVGRATVTIEHPSFKEGGAPWTRGVETWLADGTGFAAHPAWGPVFAAQKDAPRCGLVPADTPGVWACGDAPVTPGIPFALPCPRPLAMGDLAWVTVGDDPERHGLTFLPAAPGTYTFREVDGHVTFEHTASTCE